LTPFNLNLKYPAIANLASNAFIRAFQKELFLVGMLPSVGFLLQIINQSASLLMTDKQANHKQQRTKTGGDAACMRLP